jgi:hypothetical protein
MRRSNLYNAYNIGFITPTTSKNLLEYDLRQRMYNGFLIIKQIQQIFYDLLSANLICQIL